MEGGVFSGYEFAIGLVVGFVGSVFAIRYFEKRYPEQRARPEGAAPFVARQKERRKPVVMDEAKEYRIEQERMKEQGR
jgi:hypothetical protein